MKNKIVFQKVLSIFTAMSMILSFVVDIPFSEVDFVMTASAADTQTSTIDTSTDVTLSDNDSNGYYEISTADELYAFMELVNAGNDSANAELTANIVVNETLDENSRQWFPIGYFYNRDGVENEENVYYKGTFDGKNHTISGLYFNNSVQNYVGLFGQTNEGASIKNVGVINSSFSGANGIGGVCGYNNGGTFTNCYSTGNISGVDVGGVCGYNNGGTVTNCYSTGNVSGSENVGGVCGNNNGGTVTNCYYLSDTENTENGGKTTEQFESGEVAYLLSQGCEVEETDSETYEVTSVTYSGEIWGQNLKENDTDTEYDAYPVLNGEKVYYGYLSCKDENMTYSNTEISQEKTHNYENGVCKVCGEASNCAEHTYNENGLCENCGIYQPATLVTAENYETLGLSEDYVGYYAISNAGQLYWFETLVNDEAKDTAGTNAVLLNDITVNENIFNADGTLAEDTSNFKQWTAIGNYRPYTGTFDGNKKKISGLYYDGSDQYVGLFGFIYTGAGIKNVTVTDSYFSTTSSNNSIFVSGMCGLNFGTITNCTNESKVNAISTAENSPFVYAGGVCGQNNGTITDCSNKSKVNATSKNGSVHAGGVCGYNNATITNCTNESEVTTTSENGSVYAGGVCGINSGTITESSNIGALTATSENGSVYAGGVCGINHDTITESSNIGALTAEANSVAYAGGLCGDSSGTITNCFSKCEVKSNANYSYAGGVCGSSSRSGTITNCFSKCEVNSNAQYSYADGLCGSNSGTITNCYYLSDTENTENGGKTTEQFESGEVAYLLQGEQTEHIWGQDLKENDTDTEYDAYPVLNGKEVFCGYAACTSTEISYSNSPLSDTQGHKYENDICDVCNEYRPATLVTAENYETLGLSEDYVGYYAISTANELYWFSDFVNKNEIISGSEESDDAVYSSAAKAVLLNDITVNTNVLSEDGTLNSGDFRQWTPIGSYYYTGTFDGAGHTISGLYYDDTTSEIKADYVGLFGCVISGTIKNITVSDSYFNTTASSNVYAGGVCGYNYFNATIENCSNNKSTINATATGEYGSVYAGGVCGSNYNATIENCSNNESTINATAEGECGTVYAGGVCGYNYNDTIENCSKIENCSNNESTINATATGESGVVNAGGVCGSNDCNATIKNCSNNESTINATGEYGNVYAGGVCGSNYGSEITDCSNNGTVTATSETGITHAGGVCGYNINGGTITDCSNEGTITATSESVDAYAGGVCGYIEFGTITNCYSTGTATATSESINAYAGGVCGYSSGTITNCYSTGTATATSESSIANAGGVCGCSRGTITNCYSTDTATATSEGNARAGGVCGYSSGTITNCYSTGTATATSESGFAYTGGVCGYIESGTIKNCYYLSDTENTENGGKTLKQFENGEVAYLLSQGCIVEETVEMTSVTYSGEIWGQNLKENDTDEEYDAYPVLNGKKVYEIKTKGETEEIKTTYSNEKVTLTAEDFTFTTPESDICDGEEKTAKIESNKYTGFDYEIKYYQIGEDGETAIDGNPKEAGTYIVKIDVAENDSYKSVTVASADWTFAIKNLIEEISIDVTAPTATETPQSTVETKDGYTAEIVWTPANEIFAYNTAYTATITVTIDENYKTNETTKINGSEITVNEEGLSTADGFIVTYNEDGTITLTKTYEATAKAKITYLTPPENVTLEEYYASAEDVMKTLPTTVKIKSENGITSLPVTWAFDGTYDSTANAENTFKWTAEIGELDASGITTSGTITVTNNDYVLINEENFPDEIFRNYVKENFDTDGNGILSAEEISKITDINVSNRGISDLKGIEYFTALKRLICDDNNLTSLDVSNNTALTYLDCHYNNLTSLDVSNNTALTSLSCENNNLTSLDVSNNTALTYLDCHYNNLTSFDLSNNTSLMSEYLDYSNNTYEISLENGTFDLLTLPEGFNLDNVSNWTNATVNGSIITVTDLSKSVTYEYNLGNDKTATFTLNPAIEINEENFPDEIFRNYIKETFDTDRNGVLSATEISGINYINVSKEDEAHENEKISSLKGIEYFTSLTYLNCCNNNLTSLDVSNNTALTTLYCYNNNLTSLDVSNNTALTTLYCYNNNLTSLDVSNNTMLTYLDCTNNNLTSLDVSKNTALTELYCYTNNLTSLDVSNNTVLGYLYCHTNNLTSLDLSKNTALTYLECHNNNLTSLDVSNNTALKKLSCDNNKLTSLDVSKNTALESLNCQINNLTSLDVSNNTSLTTLSCDNNNLTSLDVRNNPLLVNLYCDDFVHIIREDSDIETTTTGDTTTTTTETTTTTVSETTEETTTTTATTDKEDTTSTTTTTVTSKEDSTDTTTTTATTGKEDSTSTTTTTATSKEDSTSTTTTVTTSKEDSTGTTTTTATSKEDSTGTTTTTATSKEDSTDTTTTTATSKEDTTSTTTTTATSKEDSTGTTTTTATSKEDSTGTTTTTATSKEDSTDTITTTATTGKEDSTGTTTTTATTSKEDSTDTTTTATTGKEDSTDTTTTATTGKEDSTYTTTTATTGKEDSTGTTTTTVTTSKEDSTGTTTTTVTTSKEDSTDTTTTTTSKEDSTSTTTTVTTNKEDSTSTTTTTATSKEDSTDTTTTTATSKEDSTSTTTTATTGKEDSTSTTTTTATSKEDSTSTTTTVTTSKEDSTDTTTTTTSKEDSTSTTTTVTTSKEDSTDTTTTTTSKEDSTSTTTTVTSKKDSTGTTTTTVITEEDTSSITTEITTLPQTGYSEIYRIIVMIASLMILSGAFAVVFSRKKDSE